MTDLTRQQQKALEIAERWGRWIEDVSADMDPDDGAKAKFRQDCEHLRTYILNSTPVPIRVTEEMREAFWEVYDRNKNTYHCGTMDFQDAIAAMLAAAEEPDR